MLNFGLEKWDELKFSLSFFFFFSQLSIWVLCFWFFFFFLLIRMNAHLFQIKKGGERIFSFFFF